MFFHKATSAQANVKVYTGGFMQVDGGLTSAYIETTVKVVSESAEAYCVEFSDKFKAKHPEYAAEVIQKDDDKRKVTYTVFLATDAEPPTGPFRHGQFKIAVLIPMKGGIGFGSEKADVQIVEETETHYRLRFAAKFAKEHPNLCHEWVKKDSKDPSVTIV